MAKTVALRKQTEEGVRTGSLSLCFQSLETLPTEALEVAHGISQLNLSNNHLTLLPADIARFVALRVLNVSWNRLVTLPIQISRLVHLEVLDASFNRISSLPAHIFASLASLRELHLNDNKLTALPSSICALTSLSILRIGYNEIEHLPKEIALVMPTLRELSLSGNPLGNIPAKLRHEGMHKILAYLRSSDPPSVESPTASDTSRVWTHSTSNLPLTDEAESDSPSLMRTGATVLDNTSSSPTVSGRASSGSPTTIPRNHRAVSPQSTPPPPSPPSAARISAPPALPPLPPPRPPSPTVRRKARNDTRGMLSVNAVIARSGSRAYQRQGVATSSLAAALSQNRPTQNSTPVVGGLNGSPISLRANASMASASNRGRTRSTNTATTAAWRSRASRSVFESTDSRTAERTNYEDDVATVQEILRHRNPSLLPAFTNAINESRPVNDVNSSVELEEPDEELARALEESFAMADAAAFPSTPVAECENKIPDGSMSTGPLVEREVPKHFVCPITYEIMKDPVVAADGFTYERSAIERWLSQKAISPMTGAKLTSTALTPNYTLRSIINEFLATSH